MGANRAGNVSAGHPLLTYSLITQAYYWSFFLITTEITEQHRVATLYLSSVISVSSVVIPIRHSMHAFVYLVPPFCHCDTIARTMAR